MDQPKILVAIRKRPLAKKEENKGQTDIVTVKNNQTVIVSEYKQKVDLTKYLEETVFNFDFAYDETTTNQEIYHSAVRPLVDSAFLGAKVTCFAYGQTGSGKTFTMNGNSKMGVVGLYALGAQQIFTYLSNPNFQHLKARLSYFEIYCGKLFDLLKKRQELKILEDKKNNINIIGLEETHITSLEQFIQLLEYGGTQRVTSQNSANSQSSRSHAILQISLKDGKKLFGKISFIDLAGNERGADHTDMKKQTRIDGAEINKSLLSLKECIRALDQGKGHTPFRGSKLTMVLKDSFVGFCRTLMIGNVAPSSASSENTLNTLRYADRVKQLRKPTETISKQDLKAREMMLPRQNKNAIKININNDDDVEDIEAKREIARGNLGIKDDGKKRERSNDPYTLMHQEQRPRQQSFANGKNQMKLSQHLDNKKQKITQISKQMKEPNSTNATKTNPQGNSKKVPLFGSQHTGIVRTNSLQIQAPRPIFHQNKDHDMDIEDQYFSNNVHQQKPKQINNFLSNQSTSFAPTRIEQYGRPVMEGRPLQKNIPDFNRGNFQQPNSFNHRNQSLPAQWNQMDEFVRGCTDSKERQMMKERMHGHLFNEQNQLMSAHSDSLRCSLDIIKNEMNMLSTLENENDALTTREYISFMEESIDEKISILEELRQKMASFTYKLDTMEEIQEGEMKGDDEQLLDDLH